MGYRLLPLAEEEMMEAAVFYEAAASLGGEFLDDVERAINVIRERPRLGENVAPGLRRLHLRRFPLSIIYAIEDQDIVVVAVAHQRRRPDYWKHRK